MYRRLIKLSLGLDNKKGLKAQPGDLEEAQILLQLLSKYFPVAKYSGWITYCDYIITRETDKKTLLPKTEDYFRTD